MMTRGAWLALVVGATVAGCQTEIGYGTYLCGVEQDCPDGQSCNGPDNRCVAKAEAIPFTCSEGTEQEPDDTPAQAFGLPDIMQCVSLPISVGGCLHEHETEDWFRFTVPMMCTAVVVRMRIAYPLAYEDVQFEIGDDAGTILESQTECGADETSLEDLGILQKCLKRTLTSGETYTIRVKADGTLSCDGACAFNRYSLTVRFESPPS